MKAGLAHVLILPPWEELQAYKRDHILGGIEKIRIIDEHGDFKGWKFDLRDLTKYESPSQIQIDM